MPKFFFHIVAKTVTLDETGVTLSDVDAAVAHAKDMARRMRAESGMMAGSIVVENEDAGDLFELPIAGLSS